MWTSGGKKRSKILLINIKVDRFRFAWPIPLFVFEQIVEGFCDLLWFLNRLSKNRWRALENAKLFISAGGQTLDELRSHGSWEMVEIEAGASRLFIKFY